MDGRSISVYTRHQRDGSFSESIMLHRCGHGLSLDCDSGLTQNVRPTFGQTSVTGIRFTELEDAPRFELLALAPRLAGL